MAKELKLWQLHHQNKKDRSKTVFCSQQEMSTKAEFDKWLEETRKKFPLPKGFEWLCCAQGSKYFIQQALKETPDE